MSDDSDEEQIQVGQKRTFSQMDDCQIKKTSPEKRVKLGNAETESKLTTQKVDVEEVKSKDNQDEEEESESEDSEQERLREQEQL